MAITSRENSAESYQYKPAAAAYLFTAIILAATTTIFIEPEEG
jgi:hypothetical protein